ncbi:MAG: toxin [Acidimicrobiales bacterium]
MRRPEACCEPYYRSTLIPCGYPSTARRHRVADDDIEHTYEHALAWAELGDDPPRYLVVGPDHTGHFLELVVMEAEGNELVIHAMALRRSTSHELFGEDE